MTKKTHNMSKSSPWLAALLLLVWQSRAFPFPNRFGAKKASVASPPRSSSSSSPVVTSLKQDLLTAVSGTENGKTATPEQQAKVLQIVRQLETTAPAPDTILSTDAALIDGTWYLQYTSPSDIVGLASNSSSTENAWKPINAQEGDANIETRQFTAGTGAVSAQGIKVETANRVVKQSIIAAASRVINEITLDWANVTVAGSFRASPSVPYRAVVAFDTADIVLAASSKLKISLGWLFSVIAATKGGVRDNGWLETTFIDKDIRIGRGNKGTMFVLTRNPTAVTP